MLFIAEEKTQEVDVQAPRVVRVVRQAGFVPSSHRRDLHA